MTDASVNPTARLSGRKRLLRAGLALLAGAGAAFGHPPFGILPGLLGYALLLVLADGSPNRRAAFWMGWLAGFAYFLVGCWWVAEAFLVNPAQAWMAPFANLGMSTLSIRNTGGTDHLAFDAVGLPGFQFIQDRIDYRARSHHFNMDLYDRILPRDLMINSVVMASFAYHAAGRSETKLVCAPSSESVPPTICFTRPSCKSMQGRNTVGK